MPQWLKKVVFGMCFLELIYQLLPGKTWQKYLKFTGGLIFMLILMEPMLQLFSVTDKMQEIVWNWQMQENSAQLQEEQRELEELQNEQIRSGVCRELEKQITRQIQNMGGEPEKVQVTLNEMEAGQIERVEIFLKQSMEKEAACIRQIQEYWDLKEEQIVIQTEQERADST